MADIFLVGADGSEGSKRTIRFAAEQAKKAGATLLIAHVIEWSRFEVMMMPEVEDRHAVREREIQRATDTILKPAQELAGPDVSTETIVHHGHAAQGLADLAREYRVAQVFIGRHGHSNLGDILHGSVVSNLSRICSVPVTVIP